MIARADHSMPLLTTKQLQEKLALMLSEKASDEARARQAAEAEKKQLIEKLIEPSGVSVEEAAKRAADLIENAVSNGLREVQIYRFPNPLCTDRGRAISQNEAGWESTLTGVPKEIYEFWNRTLRPLGYKIRFEIVDWPGGMPGDVGITLRWA
jgi:hypothetical protein